jgi:hypothetical protein
MAAGDIRIWLRMRRCRILPAAQRAYTVAVEKASAFATSATVSNLPAPCSARKAVTFVRGPLGTCLGTNDRPFNASGRRPVRGLELVPRNQASQLDLEGAVGASQDGGSSLAVR